MLQKYIWIIITICIKHLLIFFFFNYWNINKINGNIFKLIILIIESIYLHDTVLLIIYKHIYIY